MEKIKKTLNTAYQITTSKKHTSEPHNPWFYDKHPTTENEHKPPHVKSMYISEMYRNMTAQFKGQFNALNYYLPLKLNGVSILHYMQKRIAPKSTKSMGSQTQQKAAKSNVILHSKSIYRFQGAETATFPISFH